MTTRHESNRPAIIGDAAIAIAAGYGASVAMEDASSWLYERVERPAAREREQRLRRAMPTVVMAGKLNDRLGEPLTDERVQKLGELLHFGFGTAWAHARAFISHLVFGAAIAGLVEVGTRLIPGARR